MGVTLRVLPGKGARNAFAAAAIRVTLRGTGAVVSDAIDQHVFKVITKLTRSVTIRAIGVREARCTGRAAAIEGTFELNRNNIDTIRLSSSSTLAFSRWWAKYIRFYYRYLRAAFHDADTIRVRD